MRARGADPERRVPRISGAIVTEYAAQVATASSASTSPFRFAESAPPAPAIDERDAHERDRAGDQKLRGRALDAAQRRDQRR